MKTLTLINKQISEVVFVSAGSRITSSGGGYIEWTPGTETDAKNAPNWKTWIKGSSAGYVDTVRPLSIRATATGAMTVTIAAGGGAKNDDGAYFEEGVVSYTKDGKGNVVGLFGPDTSVMLLGNNTTRSYHPSSNIINPASYGAGTQIVNMATAPISNITGTVVRATDQPFTTQSGSSIKISTAGNGLETFDLTVSASLTATNKWIGFWASSTVPQTATGDEPYPVCLYFTPNGFTNFAQIVVNIYPGLHYYVVPLPDATFTGGAWQGVTLPATITTIRFRFNTGGLTGAASTYVNNAGATVNNYSGVGVAWIGDFEVDPPVPKAKFVICYDDCKWDLVVPGTTALIDGKGETKRHSLVSFAASYGFPINAYVITGGVGDTSRNFMDWGSLTKAQDEWGVSFAAHSHIDAVQGDIPGAAPNAGNRLFGEYGFSLVGATPVTSTSTGLTYTPTRGHAGILNDMLWCNEALYKRGFHEATRHFALPQGGYDIYVNQALDKMGYKSVRGVGSQLSHPWAWNTFNSAGGTEVLSPKVTINSSFALEAGNTEVQIQGFVDYIIKNGSIGSCYTHTFGSGGATTQTKYLFDYLKIKKDAGLIDVVSIYEL